METSGFMQFSDKPVDLKDLQAQLDKHQASQAPCERCGYCAHCGRAGSCGGLVRALDSGAGVAQRRTGAVGLSIWDKVPVAERLAGVHRDEIRNCRRTDRRGRLPRHRLARWAVCCVGR